MLKEVVNVVDLYLENIARLRRLVVQRETKRLVGRAQREGGRLNVDVHELSRPMVEELRRELRREGWKLTGLRNGCFRMVWQPQLPLDAA